MKLSRNNLVKIVCIVAAVIIVIVIFVVIAGGNKKSVNPKEENTNENVVQEKVEDKEETEKEEEQTPDEQPEEQNSEEEQPEEQQEEENVDYTDNRVTIKLTQKDQELKIEDKLKIEFTGTKESYGEDKYTYNADVYVNGELVESKLFNDTSNRVIYSSNHDAEFYIDKIDNVYIITSHFNKDSDGYYVSFVNENGEILKEYNDVTMTITNHNILIQVSTGEETINTNFVISGNELKIIYEENNTN